MESVPDKPPVIVIVGQTASGKSSLAMAMAEKFNGEIICADSRTVYQGMDIGTAKPTLEERKKVRHHLLDIRTPDQPISVADYKEFAEKTILEIGSRNQPAFMVGGTGLYVDSVLFNFSFRGKSDEKRRQELEGLSVAELQELLRTEGVELPNNADNPRHLTRHIETIGQIPKKSRLRSNTLIIGLQVDPAELRQRINARIESMFDQGLESEVRKLVDRYGWECRTLQTIGYQEFQPYFEAKCSIEEVKQAIQQRTTQYAKRQKTWFKRNQHIHWISKTEESVDLITTLLNK